jgi:hypothetical protein
VVLATFWPLCGLTSPFIVLTESQQSDWMIASDFHTSRNIVVSRRWFPQLDWGQISKRGQHYQPGLPHKQFGGRFVADGRGVVGSVQLSSWCDLPVCWCAGVPVCHLGTPFMRLIAHMIPSAKPASGRWNAP